MVVTNSPANTADCTQSVHVFTIRCIHLQIEQRRSRETQKDAESFICVGIHMYVVLCLSIRGSKERPGGYFRRWWRTL